MSSDTYQPMESFMLRWRWASDRCRIVPDELAKIRPLSPVRSKEVWQHVREGFDAQSHKFRPSADLFPSIIEFDVADKDAGEVRQWLTLHNPEAAEPIIVSWQPDLAVATEWPIFLKFWDAFCYPASDDVAIWPTSQKWLLHYWHQEVFYFASG